MTMREKSIDSSVKINKLIDNLIKEGKLDYETGNKITKVTDGCLYEMYEFGKREIVDLHNSYITKIYGENSRFKIKI